MTGHWSNYVKAAVLYLQHLNTGPDGRFAPPLRGMDAMVYGRIPGAAGLSSSSGLVVAAAEACIRLNELPVEGLELVGLCGTAEWYVGTRGGAGDHAAIKFGKLDRIMHVGSHPFTVDWMPFPPDYRIVLANSHMKAEKSAGARDTFNQRVAGYVFGLLMARKNFPRYAARMEHLRDVNPGTLGVDEAEAMPDVKVFHAGTRWQTPDAPGGPERLVTAGGRVLAVTALGETIAAAKTRAYEAVSKISWQGAYYRRDIASKALGDGSR
jgi:galactokinase